MREADEAVETGRTSRQIACLPSDNLNIAAVGVGTPYVSTLRRSVDEMLRPVCYLISYGNRRSWGHSSRRVCSAEYLAWQINHIFVEDF